MKMARYFLSLAALFATHRSGGDHHIEIFVPLAANIGFTMDQFHLLWLHGRNH